MIQLVLVSFLAKVDCVIEGESRGADQLAREVAESEGIPVLPFPAQWSKYDRAAGPIRNQRMLEEGKPDFVIVFHDDLEHSKGTKDMVQRAIKAGLQVLHYWHDGFANLTPLEENDSMRSKLGGIPGTERDT